MATGSLLVRPNGALVARDGKPLVRAPGAATSCCCGDCNEYPVRRWDNVCACTPRKMLVTISGANQYCAGPVGGCPIECEGDTSYLNRQLVSDPNRSFLCDNIYSSPTVKYNYVAPLADFHFQIHRKQCCNPTIYTFDYYVYYDCSVTGFGPVLDGGVYKYRWLVIAAAGPNNAFSFNGSSAWFELPQAGQANCFTPFTVTNGNADCWGGPTAMCPYAGGGTATVVPIP